MSTRDPGTSRLNGTPRLEPPPATAPRLSLRTIVIGAVVFWTLPVLGLFVARYMEWDFERGALLRRQFGLQLPEEAVVLRVAPAANIIRLPAVRLLGDRLCREGGEEILRVRVGRATGDEAEVGTFRYCGGRYSVVFKAGGTYGVIVMVLREIVGDDAVDGMR